MANIFNEHDGESAGSVAAQVRRDAGTMRKLRQLMGCIQSGSDTSVTLSQDDVTRTFVVTVGYVRPRSYYGNSIDAACNEALAAGEGQ